MANHQRRQWITDRKLQFRFIFVLLLIGVLNLLFYVFTLHYFLGEAHDLYATFQSVPELSNKVLALQQQLFYRAALVGFLVQALLVFLLGVYFSNRISGPIYRVNSVLKKIPEGGEVRLIKLRKHDFMEELIDNFNNLILYYNNFQATLDQEVARLSSEGKIASVEAERLKTLLGSMTRVVKVSDQVSEKS